MSEALRDRILILRHQLRLLTLRGGDPAPRAKAKVREVRAEISECEAALAKEGRR